MYACDPTNWPTLEQHYNRTVDNTWWIPPGPAGRGKTDLGIQVCHDFCTMIPECRQRAADFGFDVEGVWGGIIYQNH